MGRAGNRTEAKRKFDDAAATATTPWFVFFCVLESRSSDAIIDECLERHQKKHVVSRNVLVLLDYRYSKK